MCALLAYGYSVESIRIVDSSIIAAVHYSHHIVAIFESDILHCRNRKWSRGRGVRKNRQCSLVVGNINFSNIVDVGSIADIIDTIHNHFLLSID